MTKEDEKNARQRKLNMLLYLERALNEAGQMLEFELKTDGICEWINILYPRGIVKCNITGQDPVQIMINLLVMIRGDHYINKSADKKRRKEKI